MSSRDRSEDPPDDPHRRHPRPRMTRRCIACSSVAWSAAARSRPSGRADGDRAEGGAITTRSSPSSSRRDVVLEAGALEWLPDGKLAVATRRGEIWLVENALADDPARRRSSPASPTACTRSSAWPTATAGSTSPSAASCRGSRTPTATARPTVFETVTDGWEINGDYHEYAFGSKFDSDGNLWVALCLTGSFTSENKFRGWACRSRPTAR